MLYAGCDIGSRTAKAVIMENDEILATAVMDAGPKPEKTAMEVISMACGQAGISLEKITKLAGTGYGKKRISFAHYMESEISCHGYAVWWYNPSVRSVIDIGGQDAKAICLDEYGNVIRYMYNDKCASGTGRFLEIMAEALEIPLPELGETGARSDNPCVLSSQCVIFAETEVVSLINAGHPVQDVVAGLHMALASRVAALGRGIGIKEPVAMTGGVAKNRGVFSALEKTLNLSLVPVNGFDPQLAGAIGAALIAKKKDQQQENKHASG